MPNHSKQLPKLYMVPEEDARLIEWYKNVYTDDPILHKTAQLAAEQLKVVQDPSISASLKKSIIRELEPRYHQVRSALLHRQTPVTAMDATEPPEGDDEGAPKEIKAPVVMQPVIRTVRKVPLAQQRLLPALGWEDWEPSGKRTRTRATTQAKRKASGQGGARGGARGRKKATG